MRSRHVEWLRKIVLKVPAKWGAETNHDALLEQFGWLAREARLDSIELRHKGALIKRWPGNDYQDMSERDVTFASFPFFGEAGEVRFAWKSEYGDVPPQIYQAPRLLRRRLPRRALTSRRRRRRT